VHQSNSFRKRGSKLSKKYAQESGRVLGGIGGVLAALGGILLVIGMLASTKSVDAQPVEISATFTPTGGGSWTVNGDWSIQGGQCWAPGSRFHSFLLFFTSTVGPTNPIVPDVTVTDNPPAMTGPEDTLGAPIPPEVLASTFPAPCNVVALPAGCGTAICEPRAGDERDAENEPFTKMLTGVPPGVFLCVAVLHVSATGADADATDCTEAPTPTATPTPTSTPSVTSTMAVVQPPSVGDGGIAGGSSGGGSFTRYSLAALLTGLGLLGWRRRPSSLR
jgi:hypothetical protein